MPEVATDEQLPVSQARSGDPAAWDTLLRRYQLPLYVYVYELVRHEQASLDIVQETFINAVRHIARLREENRFGSWLFGIAHQKCLLQWRRQYRDDRLREEFGTTPPEDIPDPHELLDSAEQEAGFMKLIQTLPPPQRAVLLLRYVEDFSLEEISQITNTRIGTIKSRLHYAKAAMRTALTNHPK